MRPSARKADTKRPSTATSSSMMRDRAALVTTTSLRTSPVVSAASALLHARRGACAAPRTGSRRAARLPGSGYSSGIVISVRKPRLPKFTPRTGTGRSTRWLAARRVPSPPSTTSTSALAATSRLAATRQDTRSATVDQVAPSARRRTAPTPRACSQATQVRARRARPCRGRAARGCRPCSPARRPHQQIVQRGRRHRGRGSVRRWRKNSRLPSMPAMGEGQAAITAKLRLRLGGRRHVAQGLQVLLRVLHDTTAPDLAAPDLELRLDQDDRVRVRGQHRRATAGRSFAHRDERHVHGGDAAGLGHLARRRGGGR